MKKTKTKKLKTKFASKKYFGVLVALVFVATGGLYMHTAHASTTTQKVAIVYGDSIVDESHNVILRKFQSTTYWKLSFTRSWPGQAVCDMIPQLQADMTNIHPKVIALEFQGNSFTPCMTDSNGNHLVGDAWAQKYTADVDQFLSIATGGGAKVVLIKTLPTPTSDDQTLNNMMLTEAGKFHGVSISGAPRNSVTASGKFVWKKTCTTAEKTAHYCGLDGKITVRSTDGLHLCPVAMTFPAGCSVYSGGEQRFGNSIAGVALAPPAPVLP